MEACGAKCIVLDHVVSYDLEYDSNGTLISGVDEYRSLEPSTAALVRQNGWKNSNAEEVLEDIDLVIFTGGEDISTSLYLIPQVKDEPDEEIDFNAERDVSDFVLMCYCLDHDIPFLGLCRGMQMLAVVSGCSMIQDVPTFFERQSINYDYLHRNQKAIPDSYRDYNAHPVTIMEESLVYSAYETSVLEGCPSWHHQAVRSIEGTNLIVSATTETCGITMVEAIERTDKEFALGLQFHPEAAYVKYMDKAQNMNDFMDTDTALKVFQYAVQYAKEN
jgi:putative glutamine amidotransferase